MKAALLCAHARDLSTQCTIAFRHGGMDNLRDLQDRKQIVVQELAAILRDLGGTASPELREAVERLREALREEAHLFVEGTENLQNELMSVNAAQRRLTQAQRYGTAGETLPAGGGQLSISG